MFLPDQENDGQRKTKQKNKRILLGRGGVEETGALPDFELYKRCVDPEWITFHFPDPDAKF